MSSNVNSLYSAVIDVPNRSQEARHVAMRVGLVEVISRITGDSSVLSISEVGNMLQRPAKLLQSYGYIDGDDGLVLKMQFDRAEIIKKLTAVDISIWNKRPSILLWLFVNGQTINQYDPKVGQVVLETITAEMRRLGLTITFPLWDLDEEQAFSQQSNNLQAKDLIDDLSKRYAKEVVLVGDLQEHDGGWRIVWTLYTQSEIQHWVAKGDSQDFAIQNGLKEVSILLRERFNEGQSHGITKLSVTVSDISSSKDYKSIQKYFNGLSIVDSVSIIGLNRNNVTFSLAITQDTERFKEIIQLNEQLIELDSTNPNNILYRYQL